MVFFKGMFIGEDLGERITQFYFIFQVFSFLVIFMLRV
jgi:hypothetical protein